MNIRRIPGEGRVTTGRLFRPLSRKLGQLTCENPVNAGIFRRAAVRIQSCRQQYTRQPAHLNPQQTIRLAVIDDDSGFVTVLSKRTEAAGWQQRVLSSAIPPDELVAMKLNALLLDLEVLGDEALGATWSGSAGCCPTSASSSAPAARPSPSGCAACASESTTGSASPATPRR